MLKKLRDHKLYIPTLWAVLFGLIAVAGVVYDDYLPSKSKIIEPTVKNSATIFMSIYSMQNEYSK